MVDSLAKLLAHLIRPARGGSAGVIIVFSLLLSLFARGGLMAIPGVVILTSWFFKYAYILFDHTVRGFDEPPTLDINMLNPFSELRPLAQLAIIGILYVAIHFAQTSLGTTVAIALSAAAALFLPASVAILGFDRNLLKAAYPVAWVRLIVGLGPLYLLVLAVIGGYSLLSLLLQRWEVWLPVQIAIYLFCILSAFSLLAGVMYERRHELGLDAWVSPERTEELLRKQALHRSELEVTEAYGLSRAGSHIRAWELLQALLTTRGHAPEDYRWLCEHVASWDDPRYITRLTEDHVERLLTLKRTGEALDTVAQRLKADPSFRPKTGAATLKIARIAIEGGGMPGVARTLLADFPTRYAGDPNVPAAAALQEKLKR
jgi:hypothetical protein